MQGHIPKGRNEEMSMLKLDCPKVRLEREYFSCSRPKSAHPPGQIEMLPTRRGEHLPPRRIIVSNEWPLTQLF